MKLADKVAIVTGSSRGVGKNMALELAREGCHIVVAARTEQEQDPKLPGTIHSSVEELQALGVRAIALRTDVSDEESVQAMVQAALAEFGRIDILINNAGIMFPGRLWEIPLYPSRKSEPKGGIGVPQEKISFLVDGQGRKKSVVLPIKQYEELLEDLADLAIIAERKDEPVQPFSEVKQRLEQKWRNIGSK